MTQQLIGIGAVAEDHTGDGLRVGGGKINDNFTELYVSIANLFLVSNTALSDHANAAVEGTLAYALAAASAAGGGTVMLGQGNFNTTSATLTVPAGVSLIGRGEDVTIINNTNTAVSGVTFTGTDGSGRLEGFTANMPAAAAALTAGVKAKDISYASMRNIKTTGGSVNSWGFIFDQFYNMTISALRINETSAAVSNGILIHNSTNNFNIGDSNFSGVHINLRGTTTGLKILSDAVGAGTASVNDIVFNNLQILGNSTTSTGFNLIKALRNTFVQCDIENCSTAAAIIGSGSPYNSFINCSTFGGGTVTDSTAFGQNVYINGYGGFSGKEVYDRVVSAAALTLSNAGYQVITGITQANPAVVTYTGTDPANGDTIGIAEVAGMTQVNLLKFTVANVNAGANTFELSGINSTAYGAYTSGGVVINAASNGIVTPATHAGRAIENASTAGTTYIFLPEAGAVNGMMELSITNGVAFPIKVVLNTGDFLVTPAGGQVSTYTSTGVARETLFLKNVSYRWWIPTTVIGTWA